MGGCYERLEPAAALQLAQGLSRGEFYGYPSTSRALPPSQSSFLYNQEKPLENQGKTSSCRAATPRAACRFVSLRNIRAAADAARDLPKLKHTQLPAKPHLRKKQMNSNINEGDESEEVIYKWTLAVRGPGQRHGHSLTSDTPLPAEKRFPG